MEISDDSSGIRKFKDIYGCGQYEPPHHESYDDNELAQSRLSYVLPYSQSPYQQSPPRRSAEDLLLED